MKKKRVGLVDKRGRKLNLEVFECNLFERAWGLMFSSGENARALAFRFKKSPHLSIHSFFVFFPFVAVWTDDKNRIISWKKVLPFTFCVFSPREGFFNLIEIPITEKYSKEAKFFR